ncbi:MAG: triose-phosphate isomerase [Deltaproteobacteria bacterium]|nr:triose-phosphate isomerase [Candidatus Anaeroferrophillus wilburensis]MBN2888105.1 triose-phosphate isomerase [Deltaproteobacteria bacterium]
MTGEPKIIAGNWKMHKTLVEGQSFLDEFLPLIGGCGEGDAAIILAPNFTLLSAFASRCQDVGIGLAAQNCHTETAGAFTGETSVGMLTAIGVTHVLVGHSERRALFAEDDALLHRKVQTVMEAGLVPIFCVGETLAERQEQQHQAVVERQLQCGLAGLAGHRLLVAYEPVWAIGTGKTATVGDAQEMHSFIRRVLDSCFEGSGRIPILYGGSVKPDNAAQLMSQPDVDGVLVGGASLVAADFARIVAAAGAR